MAQIIKFKKKSLKDKNKGKTLCKSGFHKWELVQEKQFDVKQGKLISIKKCSRCGITKTTAT